jgi:acyl transferase domain-containing protein/NAD(P)-dependent dehydrogenase (short-subunit alcohol dehydrogenase family)
VNERVKERAVAQTPIAIVGIACMFPRAKTLEDYWANVRDGVDAISDVPESHWNPEDYFSTDPSTPDKTYGRRGGFLDPVDFEPMAFGISPRNIEATDTTQLLGLHVAKRALDDAGYGDEAREFDRDRASVILGVTGTLPLVIPLGARLGHPIWRKALKEAGVDPETADDVVARIADGYVPWQENSFPGLLGNVVAGRIANRLDLHGTNCVVDAACASSLSAVHLAVLELESGRSDMVLSGGLDTFNDPFMYMCFSKTPALSPTGDARPFDENGDGTILGEGIGMVVLKRLSDAERDGDRIYAVISGIGSSSDGKGKAVYAPDSGGQARALRAAYRMAGVRPDSIELVEAHGTGTKVGDATEIGGLTSVYRDAKAEGTWCALGSVKSMIGHTKAAAGAAGLIKVAMALHHRVLPPTLKVDQPNAAVAPGQTPFYVNRDKRPWLPNRDHPRRAGVSAFGFGGSNFHCVVEEYEPATAEVDWDGRRQIMSFCGPDRAALLAAVERVEANPSWDALRRVAFDLRARFDPAAHCRLAFVVDRDGTPLSDLIDQARRLLDGERSTADTPSGIYFGEGTVRGELGMVFPGQGAQYVGMLRDLVCRVPEANAVLGDAEEEVAGLGARVFPYPAFDEPAREAQQAALRATELAQPAIGAVSLAAFHTLGRFGITPDATLGHSYGELTALCAAGRLSPAELHRLSRIRGSLMGDGDGDRGSMLAVQAELERVESLLGEHDLDLVIANRNAPRQAVLSGATSEIVRAAEVLEAAGVRHKRLSVSAAFHSSLVAQAGAPFADNLAGVGLADAGIPVYANASGSAYPTRSADARELLAKQLTSPVEFVDCVRSMYAGGVRTFVEVGPGRRLSGLIGEILEEPDVATVAIDSSSGRRNGMTDLARALAQLAALGHGVDLSIWDTPAARLPKPGEGKKALTVPISGANHVDERPARPPRAFTPAPHSSASPTSAPALGNTMSKDPVRDSRSTIPSDPGALNEALRTSQESLAALVRLQEQTAELHRRFLESQEQATRSFQALVDQQSQLLGLPHGTAPVPQPIATAPIAPMASVPMPAPPASVPQPFPSTPQPTRPPPMARPVSASAAPQTSSADALLSVVAEKTGYPQEMLELSMGLDADLGIDSIKRVEILSALQEKVPDAPAVKPEHLGELETLGQIVEFLDAGRSPPSTVPAAAASVPAPAARVGTDVVAQTLLAVVAEKTGYPAEMLELSMGLDADLGIDSIKRVEILSALQERLPDTPTVKPDQLGELHTLEQIVDFLCRAATVKAVEDTPVIPSADPAPARESAEVLRFVPTLQPITADPVSIGFAPGARVWVTHSDDGLSTRIANALEKRGLLVDQVALALNGAAVPDDLAGLVVVARPGFDDQALAQAFARVRQVSAALRRAGKRGGSILASVTRLGGAFGLEGLAPQAEVTAGGLAGIVKSAGEEWPEVTCRAVDLDADSTLDVVAEALTSRGPVEVGIRGGELREIRLDRAATHAGSAVFGPADTVVITGGARGVTAEVAVALAEAGHPRLVLAGRSPEPTAEPQWLMGLETQAEIKRALMERSSQPTSPKKLQAEYESLVAAREILRNVARIEAAGSRVAYRSLDVRDAQAVSGLIRWVRSEIGPVTGLVHGAGVLADRLIEDKTDEDFERVYGTKVGGLRTFLAALEADELRALVSFSSSTARFGRRGQADYAAANEVLNKMTGAEAARRPGCRVVSINWGPWDGGMVTPSLKQVFSAEGVSVIGLRAGAKYLVDELASSGPTEVLILGDGSRLPAGSGREDPEATDELPIAFEREVSVADHPVLRSHVLDGRAVLPVALSLEWLAHGALHGNPGLKFAGVDDLRVFKGVRLGSHEKARLQIRAARALRRGEDFVVTAELWSGGNNGGATLHVRADVRLAIKIPDPVRAAPRPNLTAKTGPIDEVYAQSLFHGPALRGLSQVEGWSDDGIVAHSHAAPAPKDWMSSPVRRRWLTDPLAVDGALQALIVWSQQKLGQASLPVRFGCYRQFRAFPKAGVRISAHIKAQDSHRATADIEWTAQDGAVVARLEDYECIIDESLSPAFARNQLGAGIPARA